MHLHILGICGSFMGSLAILAKQLGHQVSGSDANVYPPMSDQLAAAGIAVTEGFGADQLQCGAELFVVGNSMSRGSPIIEALLNSNFQFVSGPEWLAREILRDRWVLAVAGTHGKTTTSSMLAWILEVAGLNPGFLIGGVPRNFDVSARLGESPFFVIEADEYDTAFFDKRSKFVHYRPQTLVLNNLEFDHADIFEDLAAIQKQFHHLVRIAPSEGLIIAPKDDDNLQAVLAQGCWTPVESIGRFEEPDVVWAGQPIEADCSEFEVRLDNKSQGRVKWTHTGLHNMDNALAAIAAARHAGVPAEQAVASLCDFKGVKRRMELLGSPGGISVYDDFAHHPTAIQTTLEGLRKSVGDERIIAVIEPRSNTMRMGAHQDRLAFVCAAADSVKWYQPNNVEWDLHSVAHKSVTPAKVFQDIDKLVHELKDEAKAGDHIVLMSNGGFGGIHQKLLSALV